MRIGTLTIVGVGLIGGSIGLAARARGIAARIEGVGRSPDSLARARDVGAIDEGQGDLAAAARRSDFMVFCTPVDRIAEQVLEVAPHCRPGTLLTDAGSTKLAITQAVEEWLPPEVAFVGSHPLAGSEKRGPEHARADLFQDRVTIVTRSQATQSAAVDRVCAFWKALGSRVHVLSPQAHDRVVASTSHVPHLVAAALAAILPAEFADFVATGFRDTTRIAAGDPALWTGILSQNRQAVLAGLDRLGEQLENFRAALEANDGARLDDLLNQGKKVRDALGS